MNNEPGVCSVSRIMEHLGGVALGLLVLSAGVALVSVSVCLLFSSENKAINRAEIPINKAISADRLTASGIIARATPRRYTSTNNSPWKAHRGHESTATRLAERIPTGKPNREQRATERAPAVLCRTVVFWCTLL